MNSQKLLILSVVAALLIVGAAVAFVKFGGRNSGPADIKATTVNGDQIVVDELMSACKAGDQCIVVDTKCSFCCNYVAINARSEALFNQMFDQACSKYKGSYCECHDLSSYPSCVNGKCQMMKWSENPAAKAPKPSQQMPVPQPAQQPATYAPATTTPVQQSVPEQAPAPATVTPQNVPQAAPQQPASQIAPQPSVPDAFGEESAVPSPAPADDLYAPLPDTYTPPVSPDENNVHVIQP